jgi:hypothetical protein
MADFSPARDRDAWATIRGYIYQVDQTIQSWFDIPTSGVLELECGEDIDVVLGAFDSSGEEQSRRLEQVKYLGRNITLRSPQVLEALSSFHEHLVHNPNINLRFVFVTNAQPAVERPSPIPRGVPALVVWHELRAGSLSLGDTNTVLHGIRAILAGASKPEPLRKETWGQFKKFARGSTDDELLEFIRRVEWKTRNISANDISAQIQRQLLTRFVIAPEDVQSLYHRLFVYVIRLLSQRGLKRLTVDALIHQLSRPALSEDDARLLRNTKAVLSALQLRVNILEQEYLAHEIKLLSINAELDRLTKQASGAAPINYGSELLQIDPPPPVELVISRTNTVTRYVERVKSVTWGALYGDSGCGKTQLAIQVAQKSERPIAWIRFRGLSPNETCRRIDEALSTLSSLRPGHSWKEFCRDACSHISSETLLVLDDLPRVSTGDLLAERLIMLARECRPNHLKLLSTSPFDLPNRLKKIDGGQMLFVEEIPRFTDEEIVELFELYGAPDQFFKSKSMSLLASITARHPTLLTAAATYLESRDWRIGDDEFDALIKGEYAREINERTELALLRTVRDSTARELLYRLNLVDRSFNKEDVQLVSGIAPQISHPFEKIHESIGLWVQRDNAQDSYELSPLVRQVGSENLDQTTVREVHLALAHATFKKGSIGPSEVSLAINHYVAANDYNQAASTLLWALNNMRKQDVQADAWGISTYWYSLPLSAQIDLDLRIQLRAMQAVIGEQLKKSTEFVLDDLDALLDGADESNTRAVVFATTMTGPLLAQGSPARPNRYLLKLLQVVPDGILPDEMRLSYPEGMTSAALIWATVRMLKTEEDLNNWLETLEQFTPAQVTNAFSAPIAADSAMALADRLWVWESSKPKTRRDWKRVHLRLEDFSERAFRVGGEILWACFVRAQIIVLAEYRRNLDAAVDTGRDALRKASPDPAIQYLLKASIGIQLADANRSDEGIALLKEALDEPTEVYPLDRNIALLKLAREEGKKDAASALGIIDQAVEVVRRSPALPESILIKSLGEKAVALWLAGDLAAAYSPMEEGVERLLAVENRSDEDKALFAVFGHVSGFLCHLARNGQEIQHTADDSDYARPERGMFLKTAPVLAGTYREEFVHYLTAQIAIFAKGLGREPDVAKWSLRAIDMARAKGDQTALGQVAHLALDSIVVENKIPESFDVALNMGVSMAALKVDQAAGRNPIRRDFDVVCILGPKHSDGWLEAEDYAALAGILPFFFQVALAKVKGKQYQGASVESLITICRQIAATASNPKLWADAADLLQEFFSGKLSGADLMEKAASFSGPYVISLQTLSLLAAACVSSTEQAVYNHLETMPAVLNFFRGFGLIYERIIIPFYKDFWATTFHQNRFRFRMPNMVEQDLIQLSASTERNVIPKLLMQMASGLGVVPSERVQSWLAREA